MKLFITSILAVFATVFLYLHFGTTPSSASSHQNSVTGSVKSVIDGDSIKLKAGPAVHVVQLIGVDAPENGQRFSDHSRTYLSDMVKSREVVVEVHETDSNGKLFGELFLNGISINKLILTDGFAWASVDNRKSGWPALERIARENRAGLWRDANAMPPWEFRDLSPGD